MTLARALERGVCWSGMFLLAAVAGLVAPPASGQEPNNNFLMDLARKAKLFPEPVEPKDFVKQSRPAQTEYVPVNTMPPDRKLKVKSAAELQAMQAELEAARSQHDRIAGRPAKARSASPAGKSADKKPKLSPLGPANAKDPKV